MVKFLRLIFENLTQAPSPPQKKNITQTRIATVVTNFMTVDFFCFKEMVPLKYLVKLKNNFQVMKLSDYVYEE